MVLGFWFQSTAPSKPSDQCPKSKGHLQGRLLLPLGSSSCSAGEMASPWPSSGSFNRVNVGSSHHGGFISSLCPRSGEGQV